MGTQHVLGKAETPRRAFQNGRSAPLPHLGQRWLPMGLHWNPWGLSYKSCISIFPCFSSQKKRRNICRRNDQCLQALLICLIRSGANSISFVSSCITISFENDFTSTTFLCVDTFLQLNCKHLK